jgi:2-dehydro-3-deoxyphosphogluconate aldolase/(4S)-4-hydroxy-2-oxoglutarate aldolase
VIELSCAIERIAEGKVVAVIRGDSVDKVMRAVDALAEGGIRIIEITFTNEDPLRIIEMCAQREDILVGAGTVVSLRDAQNSSAAGAKFIVTAGLIPDIVTYSRECGHCVIPGVFTPTEVFEALNLGAEAVKLFPAFIGGPEMVKALRAPFPGVKIIAMGGVDRDNIKDWFAAGVLAVGMASNLVSTEMIAREDYQEIKRRAADIAGIVGIS